MPPLANGNQGTSANALGYQDPQSRVTFKGALTTVNQNYTVLISSTGMPNQFEWSSNGSAWSAPQNITMADQTMDGNVTVAFPQLTGYTLGETWTINPSLTATTDPNSAAQLRQLLVAVSGDLKNALAPGKRALLCSCAGGVGDGDILTWDMGSIVSVRQDVATSNYWVTFDRDRAGG